MYQRHPDFVWHEAVDGMRFAWVECLHCGGSTLCEPDGLERVNDVCHCGRRITGRLNGWKRYALKPPGQWHHDLLDGEGNTAGT